MQEDDQLTEELQKRRRTLQVALAIVGVLVALLLVWWLGRSDSETPVAEAEPVAPAPATVDSTPAATDPNFDYRTLPAPVPTVGVPGDPSANRELGGERVVINGALLGELEAEAETEQETAGEVELQKPL
jgi:hypothetical protein